ncbi:hypothetical protein DXG01_005617 [Tephrocybe rancida]|nr:hypothetical protein DXG01_005617 [Tephrocybe rancida]
MDPAVHHHIGVSEHLKEDFRSFLMNNRGDPAITHFSQDLERHLLLRLKTLLDLPQGSEEPSVGLQSPMAERVFYQKDTLYRHHILRVNYTSYDIRRLQDVLNPRTDHRDIILHRRRRLSTKHEYQYARILGVFHVNAIYHGPGHRNYIAHRMEFVWVRWFQLSDGHDIPAQQGWARLSHLSFHSLGDRDAFGFVDPKYILRACHIVPHFRSGLRHPEGAVSLSNLAQNGKDWHTYCVNRFVDRDNLMRYHWGLGVGHTSSRTSFDGLPSHQTDPVHLAQAHSVEVPSMESTREAPPNPDGDGNKEDDEDTGDSDYESEQESLDLDSSSESDEDASGERWGSGNEDYDEMYGNDDAQ